MNTLFCAFLKVIFFVSIWLGIFSCSNAQKLDKKTEEYISKTVEFYNNDNYDSAIYYSDKILEKWPNNANVWLTKAKCLYFLNQEKEALIALNKAIEINPSNLESYQYRATIYNFSGEHERAIVDYDFYLKKHPTDERSLAGKAKSHRRLKQYEESIEAYDALLQFDLESYVRVLYLTGRASVYMDLKDYDRAEEDVQTALEINVKPDLPLSVRTEILLKKEDYQNALIVAKEVLELTKKYEDKELRKELTIYSQGYIGYLKHKTGNTEEGLKEVMASLEAMPTNSYVYKYLALISFDLGKKEEGCQHIEKALELGFTKMFGSEMEELKQEKCGN
ncbi:tetratricopeptide repeat protein [Bernardetia sp. OM2101]|uniref:tetratricopeptide repeat protein n=1 Tax=Bernardetia sp. OM2101 TaxID=3344876 RepID=UPI0035CFC5AE